MNNCRQNQNYRMNVRQNRCPGDSAGNSRNSCQRNSQNCCPLLDSNSLCPSAKSASMPARDCKNMPDREYLMKEICECSFAVNDMLLYLDTHPCDTAALAYFQEHKERRVASLKEYAKYYGPLTIDTADDEASCSFAWVETPWPWVNGS